MPRPSCNNNFVESCSWAWDRGKTFPCAHCNTAPPWCQCTGLHLVTASSLHCIRTGRCRSCCGKILRRRSRLFRGTRWCRCSCCRRWRVGNLWDIGRRDLRLRSGIFLEKNKKSFKYQWIIKVDQDTLFKKHLCIHVIVSWYSAVDRGQKFTLSSIQTV